MPTFKYETDQGTFEIESDRELTQSELAEQINTQRLKNMSIGEIVSESFVNALKQVHTEGLAPIGKGLDVAAFGVPRMLLKATNPELDKELFPDQKTLEGKALNIASQVRGLLVGGAAKLAAKGSAQLIPKATTLGAKAGKGAIAGAIGAGTQFVGDPAETILNQIGQQGAQAAIGGAFGSAIPVAGAGISKAKEAIGTFQKGAKGYVSDILTPKMMEKVSSSIMKLGNKFTNYAEKKLKIPIDALKTIKNKGEAVLDEVYAATRGNTDDVANRLKIGIAGRRQLADEAYAMAMDSVPENHLFPINKTFNKLRKHLVNNRLIDLRGNVTQRGVAAGSTNKRLIDIYDDIRSGVVGEGKRIATGAVPKNDFSFYRNELSALYKKSPSDRIVFDVIDSLYDDAAESGFLGIKEARNAQKLAFDMEKRFSNSSLIKENKLNNYHKFTSQEKRELGDVISYVEDTFPLDAGILDDLESTIASRELQVLRQKTGIEAIRGDLKQAVSPEEFNTIKNKWSGILDDPVDDIFNEIKQVRTGQKVRSIAAKAALPAALTTGGILGLKMLNYGMYRLGAEGVQDLIGE